MDITPANLEYDPNKSQKNVEERGIPFDLACIVLNNMALEFEDTRKEYSEKRMTAYGFVGERAFCCVYTKRGNSYRIISLRKANKKEIKKWNLIK
ncbi:BrnT family toxin [Zymomonas mobilis]|uniref:BrnT family toxin n=1 Tax=Zymomonas mobilis TaxID=542 RepID=UPI0039E77953